MLKLIFAFPLRKPLFLGLLAFMFSFNLKAQTSSNSNSRCDTLDVLHTEIDVDMLSLPTLFINAHALVLCEVKLDGTSVLHFDLEGLIVDSIQLNFVTTPFTHAGKDVFIPCNPSVNAGDILNLDFYYHGIPIHDTSWGGFYNSGGYAYNMGVGFDALPHNYGRVWFPCFDNFRERSSFVVRTLTRGNYRSICGGIRTALDTLGGDTVRTVWSLEKPVPSYLASISVSSYTPVISEFQSVSGQNIPIWLCAKPADTTDMVNSFQHLTDALNIFEYRYGPYRWPRVGFTVVPFSGGAMEHATNISYPLFAVNGNLTYETLYAHELSHHWWGDNVTCSSAEHMWINEGLAAYSERIFLEGLYGAASYRQSIRDNHRDVLLNAARSDGGYFALANMPENVTYGSQTYNKGADVAHSLRGVMGDQAFFHACQDLMNYREGMTVSSEEFRDFFQNYTTEDLTEFFNGWIFQKGYPDFRMAAFTAAMNNPGYQVTVQIDQYLHHNENYVQHIPIEINAVSYSGESFSQTVHVNLETTTLEISMPFEPRFVFVNRNEAIHDASLADEAWVSTTGAHDLAFANTELDLYGLASDSIWNRSEMHLVAADRVAFLPSTDLLISTDRFWHFATTASEADSLKMTLRYNGSATSTSALDTSFFAEVGALGLDENSLVLLYRQNAWSPWEVCSNATLMVSGSLTNWNGRFEVNKPLTGDYAFGAHTGVIAVEELNAARPFVFANNEIQFQKYGAKYRVLSANGQLICEGNAKSNARVSLQGLSTGTYVLQLNDSTFKLFVH